MFPLKPYEPGNIGVDLLLEFFMLGGYLIFVITVYFILFCFKKKHFVLGKLPVLVISKTFKEPTVFMKEPAVL
jgi:hypothetical protein